jgi:hypothetical protein
MVMNGSMTPHTMVWAGQANDPKGGSILQVGWLIETHGTPSPPLPNVVASETANAKLTGFIIGHIMFIVLFSTERVWDGVVLSSGADQLIRLWPLPNDDMVWPPQKPVGIFDFHAIRLALENMLIASAKPPATHP